MIMVDLRYLFVIILLCLGIKVLIQAIIANRFRNKLPLPPSPIALPIIGHIHLLGPIAHQALHKLSIRYGPLIYLFIGSIPNLIVSSAEMANEILKSNELNFLNRPSMVNVDYLTYGSADFFSAPYGLHWKFMKRICMTELFSSRALESFVSVRSEELRSLMIRVLKKAEAEESVDLGEELKELTSNVITRMMFREKQPSDSDVCGKREEEVIKMVVELNELAGFFNVSETFWFLRRLDLQGIKKRLKNARDRYDVIIERIMEEHESKRKNVAGTRNMLDILLDIYEDKNAEIKLTRENIKAFIMNIYGGGTDTSATTVEWALAEMINHPEIMKKAEQEIEKVVGNKRLVEESDLCNLSYIQAVVKETLRLHPGGPIFVRESNEECAVAGFRIPAKTRVIFNVWAIGRDPNQWVDPLEFRPERFEGMQWKIMSEKMVSFGAGRRSCPGEKMVFRFVPLVLAAVIQCFELEVKGRVEMNEGIGSSLPRATPLVCVPVAKEAIQSFFPKLNF
uniref:3,9-dihydroxypterocarpan 6A-monooxygenase n=1 Tax=Noccaea caerulescens TaxID=107243 RepID=A0A1J3CN87_NOCCA